MSYIDGQNVGDIITPIPSASSGQALTFPHQGGRDSLLVFFGGDGDVQFV